VLIDPLSNLPDSFHPRVTADGVKFMVIGTRPPTVRETLLGSIASSVGITFLFMVLSIGINGIGIIFFVHPLVFFPSLLIGSGLTLFGVLGKALRSAWANTANFFLVAPSALTLDDERISWSDIGGLQFTERPGYGVCLIVRLDDGTERIASVCDHWDPDVQALKNAMGQVWLQQREPDKLEADIRAQASALQDRAQ